VCVWSVCIVGSLIIVHTTPQIIVHTTPQITLRGIGDTPLGRGQGGRGGLAVEQRKGSEYVIGVTVNKADSRRNIPLELDMWWRGGGGKGKGGGGGTLQSLTGDPQYLASLSPPLGRSYVASACCREVPGIYSCFRLQTWFHGPLVCVCEPPPPFLSPSPCNFWVVWPALTSRLPHPPYPKRCSKKLRICTRALGCPEVD